MGKPTEEELKEALEEAARMRETGEDPKHVAKALLNCHYLLTHAEHIYRAVQEYLHSGMDQLLYAQAGELLAEDLRQAQHALSEITGEFTSDDLLGRIFSSFCIGK